MENDLKYAWLECSWGLYAKWEQDQILDNFDVIINSTGIIVKHPDLKRLLYPADPSELASATSY